MFDRIVKTPLHFEDEIEEEIPKKLSNFVTFN